MYSFRSIYQDPKFSFTAPSVSNAIINYEMVYKNDVLICDDDDAILDVLSLIFQTYNIPVRTQVNSSSLMNDINKCCPRILIIDLWMPKLSGSSLISHIKADKKYESIYILCLSASLDGKAVAMHAGADNFLAKPFNLPDIMEIIYAVNL